MPPFVVKSLIVKDCGTLTAKPYSGRGAPGVATTISPSPRFITGESAFKMSGTKKSATAVV